MPGEQSQKPEWAKDAQAEAVEAPKTPVETDEAAQQALLAEEHRQMEQLHADEAQEHEAAQKRAAEIRRQIIEQKVKGWTEERNVRAEQLTERTGSQASAEDVAKTTERGESAKAAELLERMRSRRKDGRFKVERHQPPRPMEIREMPPDQMELDMVGNLQLMRAVIEAIKQEGNTEEVRARLAKTEPGSSEYEQLQDILAGKEDPAKLEQFENELQRLRESLVRRMEKQAEREAAMAQRTQVKQDTEPKLSPEQKQARLAELEQENQQLAQQLAELNAQRKEHQKANDKEAVRAVMAQMNELRLQQSSNKKEMAGLAA